MASQCHRGVVLPVTALLPKCSHTFMPKRLRKSSAMAEKGHGPIVTHTVIDGLTQRQVVILEVAVQKLARLSERAGVT